jgi:hypothetical protein
MRLKESMLEQLKEIVYQANMELPKHLQKHEENEYYGQN